MSATPAADDDVELRAFYDDRYAGGYMSNHAALERWRVGRLLAEVPLADGTVLDYGCGAGAWLDQLGAAFPRMRVVGADISPIALSVARRRSPGVPLIAFGSAPVPLTDGSVDLVFSYHVLEHVRDLDAAVADMVRVTRPGGYICACLPCANRGSIAARVAVHVDGGVETSATGERRFFFEDPGHLRSVESRELVARFARHGADARSVLFSGVLAEVEYLARRPHRVTELLATRPPTGRWAAAAMRATRGALGVLSKIVAVGDASPRRLTRDIRSTTGARRARSAAVLAAWPVGAAIGRFALDLLPRLEWRYRRTEPAGAGQFLVFQKQGGADD